jgi:hypothetical protein
MDIPEKARLSPEGREGSARAVADGGLSEASALRRFSTAPWTTAYGIKRFHTWRGWFM